MRNACITHQAKLLAVLVLITVPANALADILVGTFSTSVGASIPAPDANDWLTDYINPHNGQSLIVLTECYGGDALTAFNGQANAAVISATSSGQKAQYGGYDIAAATALKPGAANTAQTVHNAGIAGKHATETPITGGGLAAAGFSLAPTAAGGAIESRHIAFYAGQPDGPPATGDIAQLNKITANFAGQVATPITAVGGPDPVAAPWTIPGSAAGLQKGIKNAGTAIGGSANPNKEQFILYLGDHGGLQNVATALNRTSSMPTVIATAVPDQTLVPVPIPTPLLPGGAVFKTFTPIEIRPQDLNPNVPPAGTFPSPERLSSPVFSILVPFADNPLLMTNTNLSAPGAWELMLTNTVTNAVTKLSNSFQQLYDPEDMVNDPMGNDGLQDLNDDGGIRVSFQITGAAMNDPYPQPGAPGFDGIFFNQTYKVELSNFTGQNWNVGEFAQDAPNIAPGVVPEPTTTAMLALFTFAAALVNLRFVRSANGGRTPHALCRGPEREEVS